MTDSTTAIRWLMDTLGLWFWPTAALAGLIWLNIIVVVWQNRCDAPAWKRWGMTALYVLAGGPLLVGHIPRLAHWAFAGRPAAVAEVPALPSQTAPPAPQLHTEQIVNVGMHAGRVWFAVETCGGTIAPAYRAAGAIAQAQDGTSFALGFGRGVGDSEGNHAANGHDIGCQTALALYGPGGLNVPNAWTPPERMKRPPRR
jgi:hypothetical protein